MVYIQALMCHLNVGRLQISHTNCGIYVSTRIVACCILLIYLSLVYGIYVPDWEFSVRNVDSPNYGKVLTVCDH